MTAPPDSSRSDPFADEAIEASRDANPVEPVRPGKPAKATAPDDPAAPAKADKPATGNAARVARHRRKLAEKGLQQINVQVPVAVHPVVKDMARRLRDGEDLTVVLFDLVADVTSPEPVRAPPQLGKSRKGGRTPSSNGTTAREAETEIEPPDGRVPPRPPLTKTELKRREATSPPNRPGEEEELMRQVRQTLRRGGWRASVIRRMVE